MRKDIVKPQEYFETMYSTYPATTARTKEMLRYSTYPVGTARTKEMLRYFFMLGYIHAGDQAADLMSHYAYGVAGCAARLYRPEDIYDSVEEELVKFFKDQVGDET